MSAAAADRHQPQPDGPQAPESRQPPVPDLEQALLDQEEELIEHLERDQLVAETLRPVARAHLSRRVTAWLWALRIFVVALSVMVVYTFLANLS